MFDCVKYYEIQSQQYQVNRCYVPYYRLEKTGRKNVSIMQHAIGLESFVLYLRFIYKELQLLKDGGRWVEINMAETIEYYKFRVKGYIKRSNEISNYFSTFNFFN